MHLNSFCFHLKETYFKTKTKFYGSKMQKSISYAVTSLDKQNISLPTSHLFYKILVRHTYVLDLAC